MADTNETKTAEVPNQAADPAKATETTQTQTPDPAAAKAAETQTTTPAADPKADASPKTETRPDGEKPVVPDKYDLKQPEGSPLSAEHIQRLESFAREKGLSNDQAQALLERENGAVASLLAVQQADLKAKTEGWAKDLQSDKEVGGALFGESAELAKRAVETFVPQELRDIFNKTGLGNHPDLFRTFVRIGKAMANDKLVAPTASTPKAEEPRAADVLFPSIKS